MKQVISAQSKSQYSNSIIMGVTELYEAAANGSLRFCNTPVNTAFLEEHTNSELDDYISAFVFEVAHVTDEELKQ